MGGRVRSLVQVLQTCFKSLYESSFHVLMAISSMFLFSRFSLLRICRFLGCQLLLVRDVVVFRWSRSVEKPTLRNRQGGEKKRERERGLKINSTFRTEIILKHKVNLNYFYYLKFLLIWICTFLNIINIFWMSICLTISWMKQNKTCYIIDADDQNEKNIFLYTQYVTWKKFGN